ncbi:hypothetical protein LSCM1_07178 [Leishmania martiniquensis]|uniref:Uncharacterized protein n=1 Tax=Leishmania martiniquensis TaxID=1580590 RepID=A0A836KSY5_9TRYP|nr:hypothetical protein LSCM1_07178 [Leishmania martiniquensis]
MAFTAPSTSLAARRTLSAAPGRALDNASSDASPQDAFALASLSSASPPPCSRLTRCAPRSRTCVPSSRSRNANSRGLDGGGARLRYGTDPIPLRRFVEPTYAAPAEMDAPSVAGVAAWRHAGGADGRGQDCVPDGDRADVSPYGAMALPSELHRPYSPAGAAAPNRKGTPSRPVLLRYSNGAKTRLLLADGHIETVAVRSATESPDERLPLSSVSRRRRRRRCVGDSGGCTPTLQLGAATREAASARMPTSANKECLRQSFCVTRTQQQALPLLDSLTPQWAGIPSSAGFSLHAAGSGVACPPVEAPRWQAPIFSAIFEQPEPKQSSAIGLNFSLRSQERQPPPPAATAASLGPHDTDEKTLATVASAAVVRLPDCARNADVTPGSEAADVTRAVVAAMQRGVRADLAAEQHASERIFAERHARDVSASPSIFSLRLPFRPLSELYAFADRSDSEGMAAAGSWCARNGEQRSASSSWHQGMAGRVGGVEHATDNPATRTPAPQQTPEVLLPHAQLTTPSGFTVPELLQERLLPRETKALQHKLSELLAVRGLIDTRDSAACRFTVSHMWFILLRCRKAHREQSLVDDFRRLSRALSYAFPHVTLDDVLPPLDVLEQLLVELLTCSRYSKALQSATDTGTSAAGSANVASAARSSVQADEVHTATARSLLHRMAVGAGSETGQGGGGVSQTPQPSTEAEQEAARSPAEVNATAAPPGMSLRLRLHEHSAFFPLLLSPAWSKLISTDAADPGSSGSYEDAALRYTEQQRQQQLLPHHRCRQEGQGVLPSVDALDTLCKVYQDLRLHYSEYVELCLYEELLYKQLALQFGTFTMHLHQGAISAEASTPAVAVIATTAALSDCVSKACQPSVSWCSSAVADTSSHSGGEGVSDHRASRCGLRTSASDLLASTNTTTPTVMATAAAAAVTPVVMDSLLDNLLLLVAHATYYNCVFCFPNDVYAGVFDEDFRADVMRWLFFCCHGVVLTHVQARRWPIPAKADYIAAQQKRKAAMELQLSALGLLSTHAQQPIAAPHAAISASARGQLPRTASADSRQCTSFATIAEDGAFDAADVAANSEARLAYQFDRYGRSAALHIAELERRMARLQRRYLASGPYGSHSMLHRVYGGSGHGRTPGGSRRSSMSSLRGAPSPCHMHSNLSEMAEAGFSSLQWKRPSVSSRAKLTVAEKGTLSRTSTGEDTLAETEASAPLPAVGVRRDDTRGAPKQVAFMHGSARRRVPQSQRTPSLAAAATFLRDREERARAQYRTSITTAVGKNLVALAAELRGAGRKGAVGKAPWRTNSASAAPVESGRRASASPCAAKGASVGFSDCAAARDGSMGEDEPPNDNGERPEIGRQGHRREPSAGSLISSYPLCVCPAPVRDYWLATLLRTPLWWTTRTAPAAMQQQSTQLVLWPSVPIDTDGEVISQKNLCRLQLEPWRALFAAVVVPPISKDAQQAVHQVRAYGVTLPQQQARLYKIMELQRSHHHHDGQWCLQERSRDLPVLALAPPTSAVSVGEMPALPLEHASSAGGTAGLGECGASLEPFADFVRVSSAMLPLGPLSTPANAASLAASTTTSMLGVASAPTDLRIRRSGMGETYEGCTSPFFKLCSSYFIPAPSRLSLRPAHSRNSGHARRQTQQSQMRGSVVGRSNSYPDSEATGPSMAAMPSVSIMRGAAPESALALPALESLRRCAPADQDAASPSTAAATTQLANTTTLQGQPSAADASSGIPSGEGDPGPHGSGAGHSSVGTTHMRIKGRKRGNTFAITVIPREEAKLRPRSLGPLKREALRRRAQLLADMDTIGKRDRVARQHYIVQHLKLCNAMAYTQSEAMMRRYRAHSRQALERLNYGDVGDAAAARAMAEGTRDFNL